MKLSIAIMMLGGFGMGVFLAAIGAHPFWILPGAAAVSVLTIFVTNREEKREGKQEDKQ